MINIEHISIVIIVKNGAKTIEQTLESTKNFIDVVVYDNGSTDETLNIVNTFSNVNLVQGDFLGFGPTKNKASSYAKNNWVLTIDADEVLTNDFIKKIQNLTLNKQTVYKIMRVSYYKGKQIKYSGWGKEKIARLYNKSLTNYDEKLVHEKIITKDMKTEVLKGLVEHYSFLSISDFIQKTDYYSDIFASQNKGKKTSSPLKAILKALFHFIKAFIFKGGFLDGYRGLIICVSGANGVFYKYMKLFEENKK